MESFKRAHRGVRERMCYSKLYAYCQTFEQNHVSRRDLVLKIAEITAKQRIPIVFVGFNTSLIRGMFFVPTQTKQTTVAWLAPGEPCILVARGMDRAWTRFATVKELMHVFDSTLELVGTSDDFQSLIEDLSDFAPSASGSPSPAHLSEGFAHYMALGCLCPEKRRQDYTRRVVNGELTVATVAGELHIPEEYVHVLLRPEFKRVIQHCLSEKNC